ncbi:hypothetical protein BDR26DRAFT_806299 [Obelidium mucronatum]|nr:hypothetical protein BDR26DRAFT_806299 [Obelidium mucronatum]
MGNNFQRTNIKAIPPERGAFPLDIEGLCKKQFTEYMACMNEQKRGQHSACRDLSKSYIECRMQRNLMEQDRMENIGFGPQTLPPALNEKPERPEKPASNNQQKSST